MTYQPNQLTSLKYQGETYQIKNIYFGTVGANDIFIDTSNNNVIITPTLTEDQDIDTPYFPLTSGNVLTLQMGGEYNPKTNTVSTLQIQFKLSNDESYVYEVTLSEIEQKRGIKWTTNDILQFMWINNTFISLNDSNYFKDLTNQALYYTIGTRDETRTRGNFSTVVGFMNIASGDTSYAEGFSSVASGSYSHAEGNKTTASGSASHAEGNGTTASGTHSHAEGDYSTAMGRYSHAEGSVTRALGYFSHAEGYDTLAGGFYSHAEGEQTIASGSSSHTEGYSTTASGLYSHAQNQGTIAVGNAQTALGKYNLEDKITPTQTTEINLTHEGLIYKDFTFMEKPSEGGQEPSEEGQGSPLIPFSEDEQESSEDEQELSYYSENDITSIILTGDDGQTKEYLTNTEQYFFYQSNNQQNLWVQTSQDVLSSITIIYNNGEAEQPLDNPGISEESGDSTIPDESGDSTTIDESGDSTTTDESGDSTKILDPDWLQKGYYIKLDQPFSNQITVTYKHGTAPDSPINISNNVINIKNSSILITINLQIGDILTIKWPAEVVNKYAMIIGNGDSKEKRSNALTVDWNGNIETNGAILEPVGTILPYAGVTPPKGWMFCQGQWLKKDDYPSLFSVIGTTYGASTMEDPVDPNTTIDLFQLPDLSGRTIIGSKEGKYDIGSMGGEATHILTISEMPSHTHTLSGNVVNKGGSIYTTTSTSRTLKSETSTTNSTGSGQAHNNMPPYTVINYIICVAERGIEFNEEDSSVVVPYSTEYVKKADVIPKSYTVTSLVAPVDKHNFNSNGNGAWLYVSNGYYAQLFIHINTTEAHGTGDNVTICQLNEKICPITYATATDGSMGYGEVAPDGTCKIRYVHGRGAGTNVWLYATYLLNNPYYGE